MNPVPGSSGLCLNIDESENALNPNLVRSVAPYFRIEDARARSIIDRIANVVREWRDVATSIGIKRGEQDDMSDAYMVRRTHTTR